MKAVVQQYPATWNATGDERAARLSQHWSPPVTAAHGYARAT